MGKREVDDVLRARIETVTVSGIVVKGRCAICAAHLSAVTGDSGATVYEGETNKGRQIGRLKALAGTGDSIDYNYPCYLETGIYVELDDANAQVEIVYFPVDQSR